MSDANRWFDDGCARAFWDQYQALPYQELLRDTVRWLGPRPGERWLDLGCGCGQLTAALWRQSQGKLAEIVALDCAAVNAKAIAKLRARLRPAPRPEQVRFVQGDLSDGLPQFPDARFDGVVSGLAISYAESRDPVTGRYTDAAYSRLLAELHRVLRPGGRLVFSVNVPQPRFWRILWKSLRAAFRISRTARALVSAFKMQAHGHWLRREAERGRFHYLPAAEVLTRLERAGFGHLKSRLSYAGQAYVFSARSRPADSQPQDCSLIGSAEREAQAG